MLWFYTISIQPKNEGTPGSHDPDCELFDESLQSWMERYWVWLHTWMAQSAEAPSYSSAFSGHTGYHFSALPGSRKPRYDISYQTTEEEERKCICCSTLVTKVTNQSVIMWLQTVKPSS